MAPNARWVRYLAIAACTLVFYYTFQEQIESTVDRWTLRTPAQLATDHTGVVWRNIPVRYPVTSITPLPTGQPVHMPKVQFDFPVESSKDKQIREERRDAVRSSLQRCWRAYKERAWMADELAPISGGKKNSFGGWAATLVDTLDTLWIMGEKKEFEVAVTAAVSIDFGLSSLDEINVFETTIRYLGGFLAAYDLSGEQRLLDKAIELGDMLICAFDTENRMPITRWRIKSTRKTKPQTAHETTLVAEIGSLCMEFTRLSQITEEPRWYDATDRVMRTFYQQQSKTKLPGMWPLVVNARDTDFTFHNTFSLGAMSDSLYEYLPKMHALLGGLNPIYEKMYRDSMATAIKHNLWRPMIPDGADILMSGNVIVHDDKAEVLEQQGQHLVCFAGGMFALGGKLFKLDEHMEVGKKLTDGCIWAYKALPLGIMPEVFHMSRCPTSDECKWDEAIWKTDILQLHDEAGEELYEANDRIKNERLPPGFISIQDRRYILRPEAIESVFILYRTTGRKELLDSAWTMFQAISEHSRTMLANGAIADITIVEGKPVVYDSMESFWMAETLKYFYLIFSEPDLISLDDFVFNTEAHPFKRPK